MIEQNIKEDDKAQINKLATHQKWTMLAEHQEEQKN
jgi:hypothetical protein